MTRLVLIGRSGRQPSGLRRFHWILRPPLTMTGQCSLEDLAVGHWPPVQNPPFQLQFHRARHPGPLALGAMRSTEWHGFVVRRGGWQRD
ncbi:hypothetical protein chiPu_0000055 [Chiloscyllium punctatum]|uniref:Uncharacterized protein n=1 Tax=Chiloscyllium punctatum TaxID=137246 RepID=A0A401RMX5_CHIPU|nr:hypothetical protein [Chiloscyllium punctatum]